MSQCCDIIMPKPGDTMPGRSRQTMLMSVLGVLEGLSRMLVSGQMFRLALLLGNAMGMRRAVV